MRRALLHSVSLAVLSFAAPPLTSPAIADGGAGGNGGAAGGQDSLTGPGNAGTNRPSNGGGGGGGAGATGGAGGSTNNGATLGGAGGAVAGADGANGANSLEGGSGGGGGAHGYVGAALPGGPTVGGRGGNGGLGTNGGFRSGGGGAGGYGAVVTGAVQGALTVAVTGGAGGAGTGSGAARGGTGGAGLVLQNGADVAISGTVTGGAGGANAAPSQGRVGGAGLIADGATITLESSGSIQPGASAGANTAAAKAIVFSGANRLNLNGGAVTGEIATAGALTVNALGADRALSNVISGAGSLTKIGANALTLSGNNTYTGATTVSAGELVVTGTISNSAVSLGAGTTLTNKGTISSTVTALGNDVIYKLDGGTQSGNVSFAACASGCKVEYAGSGSSYGAIPEGGGFTTESSGGADPDWSKFSGTFVKVNTNGGGDLPAGAVVVRSGGETLIVTPDAAMDAGQQISNIAQSQAGQIVQRRMVDAALGGWTRSFAVASYAPGDPMVIVVDEPRWWVEGFGGLRELPKDGAMRAASRVLVGGVLAGVDMPVEEHGWRWGAWLGGYAGKQTLGETRFREVDSTGALAGGYVARGFDAWVASAGLQLGYARYESRRVVGADIARAEYGGVHIAPSLSVMRPMQMAGFTLVPSASLGYTAQWHEGYGESGSSADQNVKAQWSHAVSGRAVIEARLDPIRVEQGVLRLAGRSGFGVEYGWENKPELTVLNTPVSLSSDGRSQIDWLLGLNLAYRLDQGPELYVDAEVKSGFSGAGIADDYGLAARAGVRFGF